MCIDQRRVSSLSHGLVCGAVSGYRLLFSVHIPALVLYLLLIVFNIGYHG